VPDYTPRLENGDDISMGTKDMVTISNEILALQSEKEYKDYFAKMLSDYEKKNAPETSESMSMMMTKSVSYDGSAKVRASELPSPAPRDHLLYLFGASDREVVESATKDPNVGQVLSLMNGFVQQHLVFNKNADLYKSLEGVKSDEDKIRKLYITILNRVPNAEEMQMMLDEIKAEGEDGIRNIVSVLVMSSEFLFLQ
jgi:hypothetical protein